MVWLAAQVVALMAVAPLQHVRAGEQHDQQKVRPAGVAGSFYPADPKELTAMIDDMLAKAAQPPVTDTIIIRCRAACRISIFGAGGCLYLRGAEGAEVFARGGDCAVASCELRFHFGL